MIISGCVIEENGGNGGQNSPNTNSSDPQPSLAQDPSTPSVLDNESESNDLEKKTLIAYFGRVGNTSFPDSVDATASASIVTGNNNQLQGTTEFIARFIEENAGGDLHLIQTVEEYPTDYDAVVAQNREEQQEDFIPELKSTIENIDQYDTVFIGYPVWSSTIPQAIKSFLSEYDLSGKTVIPFCTHAGYGSGRSYQDIMSLVSSASISDGIAIEEEQLDTAKHEVSEWLAKLGRASNDDLESLAETNITITMGETTISAVLNDSAAAQEFKDMLPTTLSMTRMGEHEYYGSLDRALSHTEDLQTGYTVGDLAFWTPGNLFALYFDEPDRDPEGLMILGRITTDLSIFDGLGGRETVRIEISE